MRRRERALEPFGEPVAPRVAGSIAVRLDSGADQLADIVRALDQANIAVANLALHEPTLDDVFLAKTGRSLEGAADAAGARARRPRAGRGVTALAHSAMPAQVGLLAGARDQADPAQPRADGLPDRLSAHPAGGQRLGAGRGDEPARLPADSYLDFALAIPFMQGALFAALNGGQDLARDIEGGFLDRLAMTPMSGAALLAGQLGGALFMGLISAVLYLVVGVAFGVGIATGVGGALVLLLLSLAISSAFACFGTFVALRAGTGEAVQGFFPLFFVLLFLSSAFFPRDLIEQEWFPRSRRTTPSPTWSRASAAS